jgi:hypothetical protein
MKKPLLLLFAGLLLVLISLSPAAAQRFHRIGHANRSHTIKPEHTNKHIRHRDKQKTKKHKPDNGESRRHKENKRQEKRRAENPVPTLEATEPEKTEP